MTVAGLVAHLGFRSKAAEVLVSRPGRLVARVDTDRGRMVLKYDRTTGAFAPEVAAIDRLAAAGLPVPQIHGYSVDRGCLLLSWTEGEPLSSTSPPAAQREVGRMLRRIHGLGAAPPFSGQPTVAGWIAAWTESLLEWSAATAADRETTESFRRWHHRLRPVLAARTGGLALFDGRPEHFRVAGDRVGMIDLHDLGPGDAAMDLAVLNLGDPGLLPGVLEGYGPDPAEREVFDRLVPFFTELRRLAAAEWQSRNPGH